MRPALLIALALGLVLAASTFAARSFAAHRASMGSPYAGLRTLALSVKPEEVGASPTGGAYGVVMDLDIDGKTATVVSFGNGDASLYLSTGGGMIGGGGHPEVAQAAKAFVAHGQDQLGQLHKTDAFPLPGPGEARFYVLTPQGVFTGADSEDALAAGGRPMSPLFAAGQDVLTALRRTGG